jgi:hypothetical protein
LALLGTFAASGSNCAAAGRVEASTTHAMASRNGTKDERMAGLPGFLTRLSSLKLRSKHGLYVLALAGTKLGAGHTQQVGAPTDPVCRNMALRKTGEIRETRPNIS